MYLVISLTMSAPEKCHTFLIVKMHTALCDGWWGHGPPQKSHIALKRELTGRWIPNNSCMTLPK